MFEYEQFWELLGSAFFTPRWVFWTTSAYYNTTEIHEKISRRLFLRVLVQINFTGAARLRIFHSEVDVLNGERILQHVNQVANKDYKTQPLEMEHILVREDKTYKTHP